MKKIKKYLAVSGVLVILLIMTSPLPPCPPYATDAELNALLLKAKQNDVAATDHLLVFLSIRGDKRNAHLCECEHCKQVEGTKRACNERFDKSRCPDNALDQIIIQKNTRKYLEHLWCKAIHFSW